MTYNSDNRTVYGTPQITDVDRYYSIPPFMKTPHDLKKTDRKINRWPLFIGLILLFSAFLSGAGYLIQLEGADTVTDAMQVANAVLIAFTIFVSVTGAVSFIAHSRGIPFVTAIPLILGTVTGLITAIRTIGILTEQGARAAAIQQVILNIIIPSVMTVFYVVITLSRPRSRVPAIVFCILQVLRGLYIGSSSLYYIRFIGDSPVYIAVLLLSAAGMLSPIMYGVAALFVRPKYRKDAFIF
ncbi:MAG: hypothetical protein IJL46_06825 [Clostridia bacterium]|nr:hypothetical protein [Clostridia bacterium]MBQ5957264.1 hypothetical protein [Clostridia bacterium]